MRFEFATAGRILFGPGALREAGALARALGRRALVVTGRDPSRAGRLTGLLGGEGVSSVLFSVEGEPTVDAVAAAVARARSEACDLFVGFGGGSAIDAAKAASALSTNGGDIREYLEVIGKGEPLREAAAPCIAIPTTAGTGAEVTRNAVLASPEHRLKVSLRSPLMLPRLAIVDPELTLDLPPALTASTGFDALAQLIEPFVSIRANPLTDSLCREGLRRAGRSLRRAFEEGRDAAAREDMALASLFGGLALANAGLGAVHGFAAPIGGMFAAPHGAVCAALLAPAMDVNLRAASARSAGGPTPGRFAEVARILTGDPTASAEEGIAWVRGLARELRIPELSSYGIGKGDLEEVSAKAANASSMKANPLPLTPEERLEIISAAL